MMIQNNTKLLTRIRPGSRSMASLIGAWPRQPGKDRLLACNKIRGVSSGGEK